MANRSTTQSPARKTVGVFSLRGGVGATSIAVNLALAFQAKNLPTCLVDLKPGPGHVALQLRLNAKTTWVDWANGNEATNDSILKALTKHDSGLEVMAAPIVPAVNPPPLDRITTMIHAAAGQVHVCGDRSAGCLGPCRTGRSSAISIRSGWCWPPKWDRCNLPWARCAL